MNIYEKIIYDLKIREDKVSIVQLNPKDYKEFRNVPFEQAQENAKKHGLVLTFNDGTHIFSDTPRRDR